MFELTGYRVTLREVQEQDLDQLRHWRNSPAVSEFMLSQDPITEEQQNAWFKKVQRDKKQQHFVICYKNQAIGSANIKVTQGESVEAASVVEPGLYIADERYRSNILAFAPSLLLNDYCFEQLQVQHLKAVVMAGNTAAVNYNKKLGYRLAYEGRLLEMVLDKASYLNARPPLAAIFNR